MTRDITIIETGLANLASVKAAWLRLGHRPVVTTDATAVRDADHVMLPGVGAFGPGMTVLAEYALDEALRERVAAGRPLLAVCLGLQLLTRRSHEGNDIEGLGLVDAEVERLGGADRVPHMGWAMLEPTPGVRWLSPGYVYFAHSYAVRALPRGVEGATSQHSGRPFVAAIEQGPLFAMQFHPELSGELGETFLRRWLEEA